jgi:hypothetical protein
MTVKIHYYSVISVVSVISVLYPDPIKGLDKGDLVFIIFDWGQSVLKTILVVKPFFGS